MLLGEKPPKRIDARDQVGAPADRWLTVQATEP